MALFSMKTPRNHGNWGRNIKQIPSGPLASSDPQFFCTEACSQVNHLVWNGLTHSQAPANIPAIGEIYWCCNSLLSSIFLPVQRVIPVISSSEDIHTAKRQAGYLCYMQSMLTFTSGACWLTALPAWPPPPIIILSYMSYMYLLVSGQWPRGGGALFTDS